MLRQAVDHRATGISQAEQLGNFVESLAGGIVAGVADIFVRPAFATLLRQIKMSVSAGNDQRQHRKAQLAIAFLPFFEQHGVNVPLEMIDCDQWLLEREG